MGNIKVYQYNVEIMQRLCNIVETISYIQYHCKIMKVKTNKHVIEFIVAENTKIVINSTCVVKHWQLVRLFY